MSIAVARHKYLNLAWQSGIIRLNYNEKLLGKKGLESGQKMSEKISPEKILSKYKETLLAHFPDQLQNVILFGSQARQEATPESDIDVLVVVNWEEEKLAGGRYAAPYNDPRWRMIVELAYDLSLEYGVSLSPLVMSQERFEQWSPLNNRIRQDGIEIWNRN